MTKCEIQELENLPIEELITVIQEITSLNNYYKSKLISIHEEPKDLYLLKKLTND